jgi:ABC-type branched-subunit amino acid transport system substrate-binding protein
MKEQKRSPRSTGRPRVRFPTRHAGVAGRFGPRGIVSWTILLAGLLCLGTACAPTLSLPWSSAGDSAAAVPAPKPKPPPPAAPSRATIEVETLPDIGPEKPAPGTMTAVAADPSAVTVAILLPMSGRDADLGQAMLGAAGMALFDAADNRFVLRPYDTKGTAEGAREAAERAIAEGAGLLLGPLFSTSVPAVTDVAQRAGINVIAFSNDRSVAAPGTFLIGYIPQSEVEQLIDFAKTRGVQRVAALVPDDRFGKRVAEIIRSLADSADIKLSRIVTYGNEIASVDSAIRELGDYDQRARALKQLRAELRARDDAQSLRRLDELKNADTIGDVDFDAVLLPTTGGKVLAVGSRLPYFDIPNSKVRLLGLSTWDQLEISREPAFKGAWYADPASRVGAEFRQRFAKLFGFEPGRLALLAYDATAVAALLGRSPGESRFDAAAITQANGFAGASGLFRFHANGLCERRYKISEITPEGVRDASGAWDSFDQNRILPPGS